MLQTSAKMSLTVIPFSLRSDEKTDALRLKSDPLFVKLKCLF